MEKSHIRFASTLLLCWGLAVGSLFAQPSKGRLQEIPPVFVIGEFEQEYEALMGNYSKSLLDVCGNDMSLAFDLWIGLIEEMEAYSKQTGFELNGIKAWFHVFFEKDGARAIIVARVVPIVRTFITAIAGVAQMDFRKYAIYSTIGGVLWAGIITLAG